MRLPFAPKGIFLFACAAAILFLYPVAAFALDPLIISEFRLRGPNGANDEFVEIYNNSDAAVTVATTDGSLGYAVAASNGVVRFIIPNGTVIPARGHYLGVNSAGYSLASYPAGNGTTATGDATFASDIPDNSGIALFNTSTPANFSLATRMDAAGSTSEANALYKEGTGYPALTPFSIDSSFARTHCPVPTTCSGLPQDTDNNATDFIFVDTNGTSAGAGQRLGAPSPENLSSPLRVATFVTPDLLTSLLDPAADPFSPPNFVRDLLSDPANNSTFGTITIRRTFTNNSGSSVTRLRFRIVDLTTFPAPGGTADLRPRTSSGTTVSLTGGGVASVQGTTLEQPPSQVNGGGFMSTQSSGSISLASPLAPGASVNVQFLLGIQQTGNFRYSVILETLPGLSSDVLNVNGDTQTPPPPVPQTLIISEFRLRGPSGVNDEFVEIYNNSDNNITVNSVDGSSGYAVAASDGVVRFVIPNGTTIPARAHFLGVNNSGYSIGGYPAGNGTTANGNATFATNINDNAGLALFRTSQPANFNLANRLDAAGSVAEPNALYKEGAGYPTLTPFSIDYSFVRKIPSFGAGVGLVQDTDDNNADFLFVDTNGTSAGAGQRLGAPGPENLSGPRDNGSSLQHVRLDPAVSEETAPNVFRDFTSDPANNSTFGTISIRHKFINTTGSNLTRLRFRIIDLSTFPAPSGIADLRPRSSGSVNVTLSDSSVVTVQGTTLEQPPSQVNGGGFNSSLSAATVTLAAPLADGDSINVQFLLGIQQTGCYRFAIVAETLPLGGSDVYLVSGDTESGPSACPTPTPTPSPTPTPTPPPASPAALLISEFRLRGPAGASDEFVEIYNNSDTPHVVAAFDGSSGYSLVASDGTTRFTIPNGTTIPARGHYLGVNSVSYSIGAYPAGNGSTATGNVTFTTNIPDNAGIALFKTSNLVNFTLANRLDAVGSTAEANPLFKEGAGYPALTPFSIDSSFYRNIPNTGPNAGIPQDINDNAADFLFVDTNGTSAGAGQRLGAPGPENLSGPAHLSSGPGVVTGLVDNSVGGDAFPNRFRANASDPANNSTFGTLSFRRSFINNFGAPITRLRFRIISLSTFPAPGGTADLRPRNSSTISVPLGGGGTAIVQGTTLEQPPSQPNGGGFNSSMSATTVTSGTPLNAGSSINLQFLLGIQQTGSFGFCVITETLPAAASQVSCFIGDTETPTPSPSAPLIISEFRLRGPAGANDEFVEIYNNSDSSVTVATFDGSSGFAVAASDGIARFTIPNGTVIPARGHYLGVNSVSYSIGAYPAGNGTTATGNSTFSLDIPDNAGLALFKSSNAGNFNLANRLDAVGPTSVANVVYREGSGYPPLTPFSIDSSFYRNIPSTGPGAGIPQDTNNNSADFLFVDTNGTSAGAGQRLGAPGPENLSGPIHLATGPSVVTGLVDTGVTADTFPNTFRNTASDPANNSTFGTLSFRRSFNNATGTNITRLRFRIITLTTFPAPGGTADLRPRNSSNVSVPLSGGGSATVQGTTLEQPPSQPNGGGFNSSWSATTVTPAAPLNAGSSVNLQFLVGIQQTGTFNICVITETLPASASLVTCFSGNTETIGATPNAPLIISEFRLRGPGGVNDEFVEIYNNSNSSVTVATFDGSAGFAVAASDNLVRFTIPNGTIIPARGHYLGVNSIGYGLGAYPGGNVTTATGNAIFTTNIPDNAGLALFKSSAPGGLTLANRLDAVGAASVANAVYKEGTGYPALTPFSIDYSFYRNIPTSGPGAGLPQDTNNNSVDFRFVDTNGTSAGAGQRLGAPGPENASGPIHLAVGTGLTTSLVDTGVTGDAFPNTFRNTASDPANNSTFGTLSFRRKFTNTSGTILTRLRFRVIDISTFPAPLGIADLRPRTSSVISVPLSGGGSATVQGTTLEQPPPQPNGGGFNSSMSAGVGFPLASGGSVNLQFLLGIQQTGNFSFCLVAETLPATGSQVTCFTGNTEAVGATPNAPLIISEFRLRGPAGANDEFVEIYNNSESSVTVATFDGSSGFAVAASDGAARFVIPNGTVIPARARFLGVNSVGYSIGAYPAGTGTATGNATYTTSIADNAGVAIFKTSNPAGFNAINRLDAVGSSTEVSTVYKEGTGYPALVAFNIDYSFVRDVPTAGAGVGLPKDTNNNSTDFIFVDTNGTSAGAGQRLGAGGPENSLSPGHRNSATALAVSLVDPLVPPNSGVNYNRNLTSDPANNSTFGTVTFRRKYTNTSGTNITRLRFRIIALTTFPAPAGTADLRPRNSGTTIVSPSGGGFVTVNGTTLEQPPNQPHGGGVHSSMSAGTVALATPLIAGSSINLQFRLGVQQNGLMNFCTVIDTLPFTGTVVNCFTGDTSAPIINAAVANEVLSANDNELVNVGLSVSTDEPADIDVRVWGDEDDETPTGQNEVFSPDARNMEPDRLRLRRERVNGGDGRVYLIVIRATDTSGNVSRACRTVVVPRNQNRNSINAVQNQAAAARSFCEANNGDAPTNYFRIGDGPNLP